MKATVFARSAIALAIVSLAACSTWDSMSKTGQATTVGATSGAVGGAVVGGPVGAVAGAVIGGVAGHEMAKSDPNNPTTARTDTTYAANDTSAPGSRSATSTDASASTSSMNTGTANGASATDSQPSPAGSDTARSLSREEDVRAVQQSLNDQGYDVGNIDGVWGPKTSGAVRKFQADHGLEATGRLDAETRTALQSTNGASGKVSSN